MLGILFGVVGGASAWTLKYMKNILASHWKQPVIRIFIMGLILSVLLLLLYKGRYAGLGTNLIHASFYGEEILSYDWILKISSYRINSGCGISGWGSNTSVFYRRQPWSSSRPNPRRSLRDCGSAWLCRCVWKRNKYISGPGTDRHRGVWNLLTFPIFSWYARLPICLT